MRGIGGAVAVVLLAGCGDERGASTTGFGGSDGGTSTGAATSGTTDAAATTGDATTGAATDGGSPSGGMTEGGGGTGGAGDDAVAAGCAALCSLEVGCMLADDVAACTAACTGELGGATGACLTAIEAYLECVVGMSCAQLEAFIVLGDAGKCSAAVGDADVACVGGGPGECTVEVAGNPSMCSLVEQCPGEPTFTLTCDKTECACAVGGVVTASCPSGGVCTAQEQLSIKVGECCAP